MTEREACERIVANGNCVGVLCRDCPLWGEWECVGMDDVKLAKLWLSFHPCEKKRVFSAEKLYADDDVLLGLKEMARELGWPEKCDGKTEEECNDLGFRVHQEWMEER